MHVLFGLYLYASLILLPASTYSTSNVQLGILHFPRIRSLFHFRQASISMALGGVSFSFYDDFPLTCTRRPSISLAVTAYWRL